MSGSEPVRIEIQRGLWFEELRLDTIYRHSPGRTMTETDNVLFTSLTLSVNAVHLDEEWSSHQEFGTRLMNSMFTMATVVGLSVSQLTQGTVIANLAFGKVELPRPVLHGDTVYAETRVLSKRRSGSRPNAGIVLFEHTGRNQRGETVVEVTRTSLVLRDPDRDDKPEA